MHRQSYSRVHAAAWLLLATAQVAAQDTVAAKPPATAVEAAQRWLAAAEHRAADVDALANDQDLFVVADELFARWLAPQDDRDRGALEAAVELAALVAEKPDCTGLPALVESWRHLTPAQRRAEVVLHARPELAAAMLDSAAAERMLAAVRSELDEAPQSIATIRLLSKSALAFDKAKQPQRSLETYERARQLAHAIGWLQRDALLLFHMSAEEHRLGRMQPAEQHLRQQIALLEALPPDANFAKAVGNLAITLRDAGKYGDAASAFERALPLHAKLGNARAEAVARVEAGIAWIRTGDTDRGEAAVQQAHRQMLALGDQRGALATQGGLGLALESRGDYSRYLDHCRSMVAEIERVGAHDMLVIAVARLGDALQYTGHYADAAREYDRAEALAAKAGNPQVAASVVIHRGLLLRRQGDYAGAFDCLESGRKRALELGDRSEAASCLDNIGLIHVDLLQLDLARDALRRAGAEYEAIGNTKGRMKLAIQLGILEVRCGNFAAAREHLESARAWFQEHDMLAMVTESLGVLAMAVDGDGKLDEAVQMNRAAMQLARSGGNRNCAATLLGNIGDLLQRQGKLVEALAAQDAALAEKLALGDRDGGSVTLQNIARLHLDLHHDELAMTAAQQSLELAGQTMHGLGEGALELENKSRQAADFGLIAAALLQHDGKIDMAAGVARCLWFAEVGRAARLREMLANRRDLLANRVGEDLVAAEETARAAVDRARMHLLALERGDGKADAFAAARVELDEANRGLEAAALAIARASRRAGWIARTEPVTLAQLQQHLRPDTALVLYQIVPGQKVFAILVRADRARIEPLGDTESLTAAIARYQLLLATDGSDELPAAKAMHKQLLGPFAADLTGVTRLVVVPDSSLAFLPFEALVDASGKRLVDRFEITYAPSATVLALLQDGTSTAPGNHLLALGDPVYPSERDPGSSRPTPRDAVLRGTAKLERLVATGDEVRAIAALFAPDRQQVLVREQATRRQLLAALEQQKAPLLALHLACHGHLDERRPLLSGLVLGDGELLSVSDVHRLQLDADLVVLSACDSGRGAIARGEGVLGLTRSFLFAGAARVVVADWQVADTNSRELMVQFYRHMLQEHLRPSQALREAKRALLETPAHSHPYHWAGFVLWGAMD